MDGRNSWLRNHYEKDKIHHLIVNEVPGNGHEIKYRGYQKGIRRELRDSKRASNQESSITGRHRILIIWKRS